MAPGPAFPAASGTLIKAAIGHWGNSGSNGGTVILSSDGQVLTGNLVADGTSSITGTLQNGSSLSSAVNPENTAKAVSLSLDTTSKWTVTADSHLTVWTDAAGISGSAITNIIGNGHTVYYDATDSANSLLAARPTPWSMEVS